MARAKENSVDGRFSKGWRNQGNDDFSHLILDDASDCHKILSQGTDMYAGMTHVNGTNYGGTYWYNLLPVCVEATLE